MRFVAKTLPTVLGPIALFASLVNLFGYVITALIALLGALLLWVFASQAVEKASPQPSVSSAQKLLPTQPKPATLHPVCDVGPYKVGAGDSEVILLNVKQGQKVKGHLVEVDNQPFDWYIMDEKNMILLKNGEREDFISIDEGFDVPAHRVNRKIPYPARWYMILDTYGKRYSRKVRVDFEPVA